MCTKTTAKYSYDDKSFCHRYEFAQYLHSLGMSYRDIALKVYPQKRFTKRIEHNLHCLLSYSRTSSKQKYIRRKVVKNTTDKDTSTISGLTWSKVEYYSIMMGDNTIKVSPEIFSRLKVTDGLLTIE